MNHDNAKFLSQLRDFSYSKINQKKENLLGEWNYFQKIIYS